MTKNIIIIGAGACGIGAANKFIEAGINPIILEARSNFGGRIQKGTLKKNLININDNSFIYVDLGANWIHGMINDNPFYALAKKLNIKLYKTSSDNKPEDDVLLFDCDGDKINNFEKTEYQECLKLLDWICENYIPEENKSILQIFNDTIQKYEKVFTFLTEKQKRFLCWYFERISINLNYKINDIDSSFYYGNKKNDGKNGECLIEGGFYKLFYKIAKKYKLNIKYNHVVIKIINCNNKIIIECQNNMKFECDRCLISVPIGVLHSNSITFIPKEPKIIIQLKQRYNSGLMNVVWLWYPDFFWPREYNFFGITGCSQNNTFNIFLAPFITDNHGIPQPILMCQTYGNFAKSLENMENSEIAKLATFRLRQMFGKLNVPDAIGCICSKWNDDIYARGSWGYMQNKDIILEQNEFDDKIFYTGEILDNDYPGTVYGAYSMGQDYVNNYLSIKYKKKYLKYKKKYTQLA
jgi:monoamine oxidase